MRAPQALHLADTESRVSPSSAAPLLLRPSLRRLWAGRTIEAKPFSTRLTRQADVPRRSLHEVACRCRRLRSRPQAGSMRYAPRTRPAYCLRQEVVSANVVLSIFAGHGSSARAHLLTRSLACAEAPGRQSAQTAVSDPDTRMLKPEGGVAHFLQPGVTRHYVKRYQCHWDRAGGPVPPGGRPEGCSGPSSARGMPAGPVRACVGGNGKELVAE